jgi:purine-binding chemotaxis protein CheW
VADSTQAIDFQALQRRLDEAEKSLGAAGLDPERRRQVLEDRARLIAGARESAQTETIPVLAFAVGGERYAMDIESVGQVLEAKGLSPLLGAPPWLLGAIVARTRIIPVLDLRHLLGLEGGGMSDLVKIVVAEHGGEAFGLAVEALEGRIEIPRDGLTPAADGPFVWIAPDRLALLDLERLSSPAARE